MITGRARLRAVAGAALFLFGCSNSPKILPKNEINEPVFHTTDFSGLGIHTGKVWSQPDFRPDYIEGIYVEPVFMFDRRVTSWASYSLLPVFWNFLLTGEQYAGPEVLRTRRLGLALHAGINGFSYSQRDGWEFTGVAALRGKFIFDGAWFMDSDLGLHFFDLEKMPHSIARWSVGLGRQLTARNSLKVDYTVSLYDLPEDSCLNDRTIIYRDGDNRSEVALRHSFYAWGKHILGPEAGFSFRNQDFSRDHSLKLGMHYRFIFD